MWQTAKNGSTFKENIFFRFDLQLERFKILVDNFQRKRFTLLFDTSTTANETWMRRIVRAALFNGPVQRPCKETYDRQYENIKDYRKANIKM